MNLLLALMLSASSPTDYISLRGAGGSLVIKNAPGQIPARWSSLLDVKRSTLSLSSVGRPVWSGRLSDLDASAGRIEIPEFARSRDLLVRAQLFEKDADCNAPDLERSWLELGVPEQAPATSSGLPLVALMPEWDQTDVEVDIEESNPLAVLEVSTFLLLSGRQPTQLPRGQRIHLATLATRADPQLQKRLTQASPRVSALLRREGLALDILARDDDALVDAVRQLQHEDIAVLCGREMYCALALRGPLSLPENTVEKDDLLKPLETSWLAKGAGVHELTVNVERPAHWRVKEAPTLNLKALVPRAELLAPKQSGLSVFLDDTLLGAWSLHDVKDARVDLSASLPTSAWEQRKWSFTFRVNLAWRDSTRCTASRAELMTFQLLPESVLDVPRHELSYRGLSGFFHRARDTRPQVELPIDMSPHDAIFAARALAPLASLTPRDAWFVHDNDPQALVIDLHQTVPPGFTRDGQSLVPNAHIPSPVLPFDTSIAALDEARENVLHVHAPRRPIPLWSIDTALAVERAAVWRALGKAEVARVDTVVATRLSSTHTPKRVDRAQRASLLWGGGVAACGLVAALYLRARRRAPTENKELGDAS